MRKTKQIVICLAACCWSSTAAAELQEKTLGLSGTMVLPAFAPQSPTAFTLGSWGMQASAYYGIGHDWALGGSFGWASYAGVAHDHRIATQGQKRDGDLWFDGNLYHPELLVQYKLYAGYEIAPYLELGAGYLWSTYENMTLYSDEQGQLQRYDVPSLGEGAFSLSAALLVDWRIAGIVRVGTGVKYTWLANGILNYSVTVPITVSYYWW